MPVRAWPAAGVLLCAVLAATTAAAEARERAAAPAPVAKPASEPSRDRSSLLFLTAGAGYRRIYDIPFYGADLGFAIGGTTFLGGLRGTADLMLGRTEFGLSTGALALGFLVDWPLGDAFHAGAGARGSVLTIDRITKSDVSKIGSPGAGIHGFGEWDFWQIDEVSSGMLQLRLTADVYVGAFVWGPTLAVGLRH